MHNKVVSSLLLESWKDEMNQEISRINEVLPNTPANEKTNAIQGWIRSVIDRMEHYKVEHNTLLKEDMTQLEPWCRQWRRPTQAHRHYKGVHTIDIRIIEPGDSDMKQGTKLISPHLCCYNGAYFMCNSNDGLKQHGTANGSQARLLRVKLKENPQSYRCEIWDNKKVWTVCASDVEFVEFEHHPKRNGKSRRFQLKPKTR